MLTGLFLLGEIGKNGVRTTAHQKEWSIKVEIGQELDSGEMGLIVRNGQLLRAGYTYS